MPKEKIVEESVAKTIRIPLSSWEEIQATSGMAKKAVAQTIRERLSTPLRTAQPCSLPVYGRIKAGKACEIIPFPAPLNVEPPFELGADCYGLIVDGDSMTAEFGLSIPDGAIAFFCPDQIAPFGYPVHVEWPSHGGDEHEGTLKRYCPQPDGSVEFKPLNGNYKSIFKKDGEFVIKGVFMRSWDGK